VAPPNELSIRLDAGGSVPARVYAAETASAAAALVLGHGAGAGQRSPFITAFAAALAALGLDVVTFDFPYIVRGRRLPDARPALEACYRAVTSAVVRELESARRHLFIGGKSMGGRVATQVSAAGGGEDVAGLVLLGYPLHPPGRPGQRRDAHLPDVRRPMLFVQGSRDAFGTPAELAPVLASLTPPPTLHVVAGGDHSFKIRGDGGAQAAVYEEIQRTIATWIVDVIGAGGPGTHPPRR
jgi:predicted alpha/beta-hydrolase family hydrolase